MASKKVMEFGLYAQVPPQYFSASGAIPVQDGLIVLNGAAVQAMTLALPTATNKQGANIADGSQLTVLSAGAYAHTVTTPANGINGNKLTATFAPNVGSNITLVAVNGIWVVLASTGITLS